MILTPQCSSEMFIWFEQMPVYSHTTACKQGITTFSKDEANMVTSGMYNSEENHDKQKPAGVT